MILPVISKLKYLVIENAPDVCDGIEQRMKVFEKWVAMPYSVSPVDAIEKIERERPQLLFMDWSLNGGSAYEVLDHIKKMPSYRPYIIFNTGYQKDNPEIPQTIFNNYKIDKYIIKPIWQPLRDHLQQYLAEAEDKWENQGKKLHWITDYKGARLSIDLHKIICICQHPVMQRCRNIFTEDTGKEITVAMPWYNWYKILRESDIDFFITKSRSHLVTKKYVLSFNRPIVHLKNFDQVKIEVVRENVKAFENWLFGSL